MKKEKIDVLYLFEHVVRELDTACIVKYYCEKNGLVIKVVSLNSSEYSESLLKYDPKIVVLPYCYLANVPPVSQVFEAWPNSYFFNLNCEQFFSNALKKYKAPRGEFIKKNVLEFAWSTRFKDYLLSHGVNKNNIFISGNPNFYLCQKPYRDYYLTKEELANKYKLDPNKKWFFFPENFSWAFLTNLEIINKVRSKYKLSVALQNRYVTKKTLNKTAEWLFQLSKRDDMEIIFRPRPAISTVEYQNFFSTLGVIPKNFHIIKNETAREWVMASDFISSSYSTVLIEAIVLGKTPFIVFPYKLPDAMKAEFLNYFPKAKNYKDFIELTKQTDFDYKKIKALINENTNAVDAIRDIADILISFSKKDRPIYKAREVIKEKKYSPLIMISLRMIAKALGSSKAYKQRFEFDNITEAEISSVYKVWETHLKKFI